MKASLEMLSEKGVEATTIEEITERADLGKGTFYRHFPNKDAVVAALTEDLLEQIMQRIPAGRPRSGLDASVGHLLDIHLTVFADKGRIFTSLFQEGVLARLQRARVGELGHPYPKYLQALSDELAPHVERDEAPEAARKVASVLFAVVSVAVTLGMIGMQKEKAGAAIAAMRPALMDGLARCLKRESENSRPAAAAVPAGA